VDDIGLRLGQHRFNIAEAALDLEAFAKLASHQLFAVTDGDDFAAFDALNLRRMRVGDFAATDDGDLKHVRLSFCNCRNSAGMLRRRRLFESSRGGS